MATETGAKWVIGLVIYFFVFIVIVTIANSFGEGAVINDYGINSKTHCDNPRIIYQPYTIFQYSTDDIDDLSSLDCSKTAGVFNENKCIAIEGCLWGNPNITASGGGFKNLFTWFRNVASQINDNFYNESVNDLVKNTCYGTIDYEKYQIETFTDVFGDVSVADHDNTNGIFRGSICNHPSVYNNQSLCSLFSCTWTTEAKTGDIENLDIPKSALDSTSAFNKVVKSIAQIVTFRYDFQLEDDYATFLITFILFYLPLITLIIAIYLLIRGG